VTRPAVDVVVPFAGSDDALEDLLQRVRAIRLEPGDTLTVVDNRAGAQPREPDVIAAAAEPSSYYARNRGAERGSAPWILFIDADVEPPADLVERYFAVEPGDDVGVLAGGIVDAALPAEPTVAERYAVSAEQMSQQNTLRAGAWAYAQTANAMIRRTAFEQVGGFEEGIRSGGDADMCFRLRVAGWSIDGRLDARVVHRNRATVMEFFRQKARHGAGAAWLDQRYPGSFPARPRRPWLRRLLREIKMSVPMLLRAERQEPARLLFATAAVWAFELGRMLPNRVKRR